MLCHIKKSPWVIAMDARPTGIAVLWEIFQIIQHVGGVGVGFDLWHDFFNHAVFVNDECGANHAHAHLAVELLFLPDAVGFNGLTFGVGEQHEGKRVLLGKTKVRRGGVLADADDLRSHRSELLIQRGEGLRLTRAASSVVLGIKVNHDLLTAKVREFSLNAVLVRQGEIRCDFSDIEHFCVPPCCEMLFFSL